MAELLLYASLFLIIYVYIGYPLLTFFLAIILNRNVKKGDYTPFVTVVISAYNEENCIGKTLDNKLELDYPNDKIEFIVVSDGSTDQTDQIVHNYANKNIRLIRKEPRSGKTSAINWAVQEAKGNILIFSDANSIFSKNCITNLVKNFCDDSVGYVTGKMIYVNADGSTVGDGCSTYMKYENALRKYETKIGSIVGVDGGVDAMRRSLFRRMNVDQLPDFALPLSVVEQGYRIVYEPEAILMEKTLNKETHEYKMRVRVSLRALWTLYDFRHMLLSNNYLLFGWQMWSHKVLRYSCFIWLLIAYISNVTLLGNSIFYFFLFVIQNLAYTAALIPKHILPCKNLAKICGLSRYFILINIASAHAFIKFFLKQKQVIWTPRKG